MAVFYWLAPRNWKPESNWWIATRGARCRRRAVGRCPKCAWVTSTMTSRRQPDPCRIHPSSSIPVTMMMPVLKTRSGSATASTVAPLTASPTGPFYPGTGPCRSCRCWPFRGRRDAVTRGSAGNPPLPSLSPPSLLQFPATVLGILLSAWLPIAIGVDCV